MACEESSCYGAPHFLHAQPVCPSICLVPDTLALLPLSVCCVSASTFALSITVASVKLHLRTGDKTYELVSVTLQFRKKQRNISFLVMRNMKNENEMHASVISCLFCMSGQIVLPLNVSWYVVLYEVVEFVVVQEGACHISPQFHV